MLLVGRAVGQVYTAEAAKLAITDIPELERMFKQTALRLLLLGAGMLIPIVLAMQVAIVPIFGAVWKPAGAYILVLSPALLAQFVNSPLSQTLVLFRRLRLQAFLDALRLICIVVALAACYFLKYSVTTALALVSLISVILYGVYFGCYLTTLQHHRIGTQV
jgi:O-antigen/teichoic acid export membrane protein